VLREQHFRFVRFFVCFFFLNAADLIIIKGVVWSTPFALSVAILTFASFLSTFIFTSFWMRLLLFYLLL